MPRAQHAALLPSHELTTAQKIETCLTVLSSLLFTIGMIGCGSSLTEVLLECPSPDRRLVGVVWAEVVGRSTHDLVSIRAGDTPMHRLEDRRGGELSPVLAVDSAAAAFALKWETNDSLLITVTHPDRADVSQITDRRTIRGRQVRVAYQEVKIDREVMTTKAVCESDMRRIENPAPRRLK